MPYDHQAIEKKWQKKWEESGVFKTNESSDKKKFYALDMFPYPSGAGLHVGHPKGYIATDVVARYKMMSGFNVLHPMGWDAFGLPAENYAIKNRVHPSVATEQNIETFKRQLSILGFTYDWEREVNTTDPKYYKWTQWAFLQMFKKGLAYESFEPINWCPSCQTGLANEDLDGDKCERCGSLVEQKPMRQWVLKITNYADRLLNDLSLLPEWPESIKQMQREWIGRSEGAEVNFQISKFSNFQIKVFTTRPDTLFGATYLVLAPEHELVEKITTLEQKVVVENYLIATKNKTDIERGDDTKEKTGVFTGTYAINPVNNEEIPIWVADYVLSGYGTGAIMAVPAHDERDFAFAKKFDLPIKQVVEPKFVNTNNESDNAVKPDLPFVDRNAVVVVVKNPKDDTYLCISWKNFLMHGLVTGGVEDGEDPVKTAQRELVEETGYKNFRYIRTSPIAINTYFYHRVKQQNRHAHFQFVFFELENEERVPMEKADEAQHEVVWKKKSELKDFFTVYEGEFILNILDNDNYCFADEGVVVNSGFLDGLPTWKAKDDIISWLEEKGLGQKKIQYKLRDWVFSRQRYWGEPIPLVHCEKCGIVPLSESELPLELPRVEHYEPSGTGESPLATIDEWVNTKCPVCGGPAKRETNTMPQWAGSCWYYLRYCDPKNNVDFFKNNGFKFRPAIEPTEMDKKYFEEFKNIYSELKNQKISVWTANRFLLNGLNGNLWLPFRTICLMTWESDRAKVENYLGTLGYKLIETHGTNYLFEKDGVRVEIVAMFNEDGKIFSWSYQNARQEMLASDLPENELGHLWNFSFRIVSPEYNLRHYKYIQENESADRAGLGDDDKISFLQSWVGGVNEKIRFWQPVDLYVGGAEHATRHLIYARFWHKFLYDLGVVSGEEPFMRLQNVGLILAEDGRKMSKRWGNVINPDDVVKEYGADALRVYEMFMGPFNQPAAWNTNGLVGTRRFLEKVNGLVQLISETESNKVTQALHQTIKKVGDDIDDFRFNTAVAQMMTFVNVVQEEKTIARESFLKFLQVLCPFAPHITNEIALGLGGKDILEVSGWPTYDSEMLKADTVTIAVQVNGKLRGTVEVSATASEEEIRVAAVGEDNVKKYLDSKEIVKVIFVPGKLVNIVIK